MLAIKLVWRIKRQRTWLFPDSLKWISKAKVKLVGYHITHLRNSAHRFHGSTLKTLPFREADHFLMIDMPWNACVQFDVINRSNSTNIVWLITIWCLPISSSEESNGQTVTSVSFLRFTFRMNCPPALFVEALTCVESPCWKYMKKFFTLGWHSFIFSFFFSVYYMPAQHTRTFFHNTHREKIHKPRLRGAVWCKNGRIRNWNEAQTPLNASCKHFITRLLMDSFKQHSSLWLFSA